MKTSTIQELKEELQESDPSRIRDLCLRLAKFKKENKELLTYLLFESHDLEAYINSVKSEMEVSFSEINLSNLYYAKKSLRKILRSVNKYIRYTGENQAEIDLLIHYCKLLKESGIPFERSQALVNIYSQQLKKIRKCIGKLHEDLQYDYQKEINVLE